MSAPRTRVAVAVAVTLLLLALAGGLSWQHMRSPSATHVEMLATGTMPMREAKAPPSASSRAATPTAPEHSQSASPAAALNDAPSASASAGSANNEPAASPSFDIVRVEPTGDALLAGRSKPNDTVALLDRGKVVAQAKADAGGNFVMTPPALKPGDYALSLRTGQGAAARESKQSVVVSVPASKTQQVVVAVAEPGKPTTLLSAPPAAAPAGNPRAPSKGTMPVGDTRTSGAAAAPPRLTIGSVELENGSGLFASGTAAPGTDVRVYLNNSRVADVIAAAAGGWSVRVRRGLSAGRYAVRADALQPSNAVGARVEVPFDVPIAQAEAQGSAAAAAPAPTADDAPVKVAEAKHETSGPAAAPSRSAVVVDELKTALVSRGDNLWRISRRQLGHGTRFTEIYAANVTQIRDPKLVYPGQVFVLPEQ